MTEDERVERRAELLPEEQAAGSADPEAQAEAILDESDERQVDRDVAHGNQVVEKRRSEDTTPPPDSA